MASFTNKCWNKKIIPAVEKHSGLLFERDKEGEREFCTRSCFLQDHAQMFDRSKIPTREITLPYLTVQYGWLLYLKHTLSVDG
jgi:hypothetical protein